MSKIICDICGTAYTETAKQCPICGSVRPGDVQRVTNEVKSDGKVSTGYTYVKGGRFSKSNVKKRSKADNSGKTPSNNSNGQDAKSNRGLVATAIVLLLAIIGVVIYIALRFFAPISDLNNTQGTENNVVISCVDLVLDETEISFDSIGVAKLLNVTVNPENTTDKITYSSEDESIATVSDKGKITAVAEGTTKIVITCGSVVKECVITIQLPEETTLPTVEDTTADATGDTTEDTTEDTTVPDQTVSTDDELRLNRKDITFAYKGESWVLYSGNIAKNLITWTSDNDAIVTFSEGKAVAVGSGMTEVHAEYNGQKVSCIIRCNFTDNSGVVGNGGVSEDGGSTGNGGVSEDGSSSGTVTPVPGAYTIYSPYGKVEDITLKVGESLNLSLKDSAGNVVEATWSSTGSGVSVSGSTIRGEAKTGYAKVIATYNGNGYECIVRVN